MVDRPLLSEPPKGRRNGLPRRHRCNGRRSLLFRSADGTLLTRPFTALMCLIHDHHGSTIGAWSVTLAVHVRLDGRSVSDVNGVERSAGRFSRHESWAVAAQVEASGRKSQPVTTCIVGSNRRDRGIGEILGSERLNGALDRIWFGTHSSTDHHQEPRNRPSASGSGVR